MRGAPRERRPDEVQIVVANSELAIERGDFDKALHILGDVPPESPAYVRVQVCVAHVCAPKLGVEKIKTQPRYYRQLGWVCDPIRWLKGFGNRKPRLPPLRHIKQEYAKDAMLPLWRA